MKLNKLLSKFNTTNSEDISNYIQTERFNSELKSMSKEITFDMFKEYLDKIFKNDTRYKLFNRDNELKKKYTLIIPHKDIFNWWNEKAYFYFNYNKGTYIGIIPANEIEKKVFNTHFFIFQKNEVVYNKHISFLNELNDIEADINFYKDNINTIKNIKKPKFEDIHLKYNWIKNYDLNLINTCVKKCICKRKNCPNNNTCKYYCLGLDYFQNLHNVNILFNSIIEYICKKSNSQVYIKQDYENNLVWYCIHNFAICLTLPKITNNRYSTARCEIINLAQKSDNNLDIDNIYNYGITNVAYYKSRNGLELYLLYSNVSNYITSYTKYIIKNLNYKFDPSKYDDILILNK